MKQTVGDLKQWLEKLNVPDDAQLWIEYPEQLAQPEIKHRMVIRGATNPKHIIEDFEAIECMSWVYDPKTNRFYIQHHY